MLEMPVLTVPNTDRVILLVLGGLRPDAIDTLPLPTLRALRADSAHAMRARTVTPSVTAAAMASLLTGVPPVVHGIGSDGFHIPRRRLALDPLASVLGRAGLRTTVFMRELPRLYRSLALGIAGRLGITDARFGGRRARDLLIAARPTLEAATPGLVILHWPDADDAGREHGWMSTRYADAARDVDDTLCDLLETVRLDRNRTTMLAVVADHGGGGASVRTHDSPHPLDMTIPVFLAGGGVTRGAIREHVSLLDVPPTITVALGITPVAQWPGRVLREAFAPSVVAA